MASKSHRMFNHNAHGRGGQAKLAALLKDIQSQTTNLQGALAVAGTASPPVDNTQLIAELTAVANDAAKMIDDVQAVITSLEAQQSAPQPAPTPSPTPTPAPQPLGAPSGIAWPSFQGTDGLVGTSASGAVRVYVDASLGADAIKNATDLLADADRVVGINDAVFGIGKQPATVNVLLYAMGATDGTGGADHMGCDWRTGNDIEVCVSYGNSARCSGLFEAELSECAMNNQLCGLSTGEALSRWCAAIASSDALSDFASAPTWQQDGLVNWVDNVEDTDQDPDSVGCGMAFISYLLHRGATLPQIAQAMVKNGDDGTLAQLYASLKMGSASLAWSTFIAAVRALGTVTSDDPFGQVTMAMKQHEHI